LATKRRGDTGKRRAVGTAKRRPVTGSHRPVNGRRPGTGGYRAQSEGGGGGKAVFFILVLLVAGGAGAGWAFREDIFGPSGIKPVTIPDEPAEPPVKKPIEPPVRKPVEPPVRKPVEPPVKKPPDTPDNGRAAKAIAEGHRLLAGLKYAPAASAFGRVGAMKCSKMLAGEAGNLERKARTFKRLSGEVKPRVEVGQKLQIVELIDGRKLRGVVTKLPDGSYRVVQGTSGAGQMILPLAADDIRSFRDVDPAARTAEIRKDLAKRVSRLGAAPSPAGLVDAAVFALENGLKGDSHGLLERAWTGAEKMRNGGSGKDLVALVAEHRAGKLWSAADWYYSADQKPFARAYCNKILGNDEYKKTSFGDSARRLLALIDKKDYKITFRIEAPPPPRKTINPIRSLPPAGNGGGSSPPPKVTVSSITSKRANLSEANAHFKKGLEHYIKGRPGRDNFRHHLSQALRYFRKAQKIYERAAQADPRNHSLESRVQDCNMKIHSCMKMMPVF